MSYTRQMIDPEVARLYDQELERGESTRWSGHPNARRIALKALPVLLFAIPWTAFALFWMAGAAGFKVPDFSKPGIQTFFPLFGIPFVLIGLLMLSAPYWAWRGARRTGYFITDRRVIIIEKGWRGFEVRTFLPGQLGEMVRTQRKDGSGDLVFDREYRHGKNGTQTVRIGFLGIPDVRQVEAIIRKLPGMEQPDPHAEPL